MMIFIAPSEKKTKLLLPEGFNHALGHAKNAKPHVCYFRGDELGKGEVRFEYLKTNGELRQARGTLCHGISEAFDNYAYKDRPDVGQRDFGIIVYFDLDKEEFRSLHVRNLVVMIKE